MALFKLKCDLFPYSSALCDILSQFWTIVQDPYPLIAIPSLCFYLMMNSICDNPIIYASVKGQCSNGAGKELSLKSENNLTEMSHISAQCVFFLFLFWPLYWRFPLGGWSPYSAMRLTSASPSNYSPRDVGGQCYQVEWCYKINWMLRWGKCWRLWTERIPAQNNNPLQLPWALQTGTWA